MLYCTPAAWRKDDSRNAKSGLTSFGSTMQRDNMAENTMGAQKSFLCSQVAGEIVRISQGPGDFEPSVLSTRSTRLSPNIYSALPRLAARLRGADATLHPRFSAVVMKGPICGGLNDVEENDAGVQEAADFAVKMLGQQSNSLEPFTLVEIVNVKRQVVAGLNYFFKLKVRAGKETSLYEAQVYRRLDGVMELIPNSVSQSKHMDG
eukprot:jgi/Mesvir1/27367/Mv07177-RA.1